MKCPFCAAPDSRVVDSRTTDDGNSIDDAANVQFAGKDLPLMKLWKKYL